MCKYTQPKNFNVFNNLGDGSLNLEHNLLSTHSISHPPNDQVHTRFSYSEGYALLHNSRSSLGRSSVQSLEVKILAALKHSLHRNGRRFYIVNVIYKTFLLLERLIKSTYRKLCEDEGRSSTLEEYYSSASIDHRDMIESEHWYKKHSAKFDVMTKAMIFGYILIIVNQVILMLNSGRSIAIDRYELDETIMIRRLGSSYTEWLAISMQIADTFHRIIRNSMDRRRNDPLSQHCLSIGRSITFMVCALMKPKLVFKLMYLTLMTLGHMDNFYIGNILIIEFHIMQFVIYAALSKPNTSNTSNQRTIDIEPHHNHTLSIESYNLWPSRLLGTLRQRVYNEARKVKIFERLVIIRKIISVKITILAICLALDQNETRQCLRSLPSIILISCLIMSFLSIYDWYNVYHERFLKKRRDSSYWLSSHDHMLME